jgi:hypothetical protein
MFVGNIRRPEILEGLEKDPDPDFGSSLVAPQLPNFRHEYCSYSHLLHYSWQFQRAYRVLGAPHDHWTDWGKKSVAERKFEQEIVYSHTDLWSPGLFLRFRVNQRCHSEGLRNGEF